MDESLKRTKDDVVSLNKAVQGKNALSDQVKSVNAKLNLMKQSVSTLNKTIEDNKKEIADKNAIIQALGGENQIDNSYAEKLVCSICTSAFEQSEFIVATKCGHIYHKDCLHPWLNT